MHLGVYNHSCHCACPSTSTTWDMQHNGWIQLDPIKYFSQWEKELFNRCASSTLNCIMLGLCVGIMLQSTAIQ